MYNKVKMLLPVLCCSMLLMGCTKVEETFSEQILDKSGILETEEYLKYMEYQKAGKIDEDGYYKYDFEKEENSSVQKNKVNGSVLVSFADNKYIKISYYKDEACKTQIDTKECFMNPGECIYVKYEEELHPESTKYTLNEFRIREFDSTGTFSQNVIVPYKEDGFIYQIPENYTGEKIAILPIGIYPNIQVLMSVYTTDNTIEDKLIDSGIWYVNNEKCTSDTVEVSSIDSYTVMFDFDEENYFYVGSSPECFTLTPQESGVVEFPYKQPKEENDEYKVELHRYLSLKISCEDDFKYKLNDSSYIEVEDGLLGIGDAEIVFDKLKYGDRIIVETTSEIKISGDYLYLNGMKENLMDCNKYVITIVESMNGDYQNIMSSFNLVK